MFKVFLFLVALSLNLSIGVLYSNEGNGESDATSRILKEQSKPIVLSTKQIHLKDFPNAYNPSLIKLDEGFLLSFRFCSNLHSQPWISFVGVVLLNDFFEPISSPQLLNTRVNSNKTPSQAEDARIFSYRGRLFLIYNDNLDVVAPTIDERRDMVMVELIREKDKFSLSAPLKLIYSDKYHKQNWQKNWVPFIWNDFLLLTYSICPHEILYPNLISGECYRCYESATPVEWKWGPLRGSTPPILDEGQYIAFFHSGIYMSSHSSYGWPLWHYFTGCYTFSSDPPFNITKISPSPIIAEGFYTQSVCSKRVIFPGGAVFSKSYVYLAYGKDDCEIWIATLDKKNLLDSLKNVP